MSKILTADEAREIESYDFGVEKFINFKIQNNARRGLKCATVVGLVDDQLYNKLEVLGYKVSSLRIMDGERIVTIRWGTDE